MSEETYKPWAQPRQEPINKRAVTEVHTHTSFVHFAPNNGQAGLEPKFLGCFLIILQPEQDMAWFAGKASVPT